QSPKGFGSGGYLIWPLFGTSNQLLAGITFVLISIWLYRNGRNITYTIVPGVFVLFMTIYAMVQQVFFDWMGVGPDTDGFEPLLFILGLIILAFAVWVVVEAARTFFAGRSEVDDIVR